MMAMGILLIFVALLYTSVIYPRMDQIDMERTSGVAEDVCNDLGNAINTATYNGNGFSQTVTMPATLGGKAYNITVYSKTINIAWDAGDIFCQFRAKNITYGGEFPPFLLNISNYLVVNADGVITLA